jgi:hypothetical protein
MRSVIRAVAACAAVLVMAGGGRAAATSPAGEDTQEVVRKVRRAFEKLPYYGVFDFLAFSVRDHTITLKGFAHRPSLKAEAESMVERAVKADVVNQIEVLPASTFGDRIRWDAYQRVYTDDIASRYVAGGLMQVRYELLDMTRFAGMEPYGTYPVHIIVKGRTLLLIGVLDNELDKTSVLLRARQVPNTAGVEDSVMIRSH